MRIVDLRVIWMELSPLARPVRSAISVTRERSLSILEVVTDEGINGMSIAGGYQDLAVKYLKDVVVGEDPFFTEHIWHKMYRGWRRPIAKGEIIAAMSGVDIALWDIISQALGQPLYKVLGAYRDAVPAYAAGGYYQEGKNLADLADEMRRYVEMGYRAVKMKVGGAPWREDVERVRVVREAIGDGIELMVDANGAWDAPQALRFGHAIAEFQPYWFEEPVPPTDLRGAAQVAAALDTPVALGENEFTRFGFREVIAAQAADILQPNVGLCGGVSEWRKIAAMASAYHLPVAPHSGEYEVIHLVASIENGLTVETYPELGWVHEIAAPFEFRDGFIHLPNRPGIGVEWDWDKIRHYQVTR
jgi:D-arabinonate dehydratase